MKQQYPKTKTGKNEVGLRWHRGNMLLSFKILGEFWETDQNGEATTDPQKGILEWHPSEIGTLSITPDNKKIDYPKMFDKESPEPPMCLQGVWLENIDGVEFSSAFFTADAYVSSVGTSHAQNYSFGKKRFSISALWTGQRPINIHKAKYSQMTFSFKSLERWIRHFPNVVTEKIGTHRHISGLPEWDILKDFQIPTVGRVQLLCGYTLSGNLWLDSNLQTNHIWQINFSRPKTYGECQDILIAFWHFLSVAIGSSVQLLTWTLVEKTQKPSISDRFVLRVPFKLNKHDNSEMKKILDRRREYIPLNIVKDSTIKKWIRAYLDPKHRLFETLSVLLTCKYRFPDTPSQYQLLWSIQAIESLLNKINPGEKNLSLKKKIQSVIATHTPSIFPEELLNTQLDGVDLPTWVDKNRGQTIAHIEKHNAIETYNISAGAYAEQVLWLASVSLLLLHYEILSAREINKCFWLGYRADEEIKWMPEKIRNISIFADEK